ncbi:aryl hydrocarbon receptor [Echinococcus multilocularis]|uniref:Aryl hydrocarbon receptor n=1 Tax=Echinococcus multilocularis TaxID=6211 RepID=A0A068Y4A2_ECHMU|nr:aryl hydrocarbon receptor [Echinococcus multilocularis]
MVDDWVIKTMYATKRRRKNTKMVTNQLAEVGYKVECGTGNTKSNPSKRHRERLNAELEHLASLLPFEQSVIAKLDKLSILRLAVSYLRMKGYFQALSYDHPMLEQHRLVSHLYHCPLDIVQMEGEASLQALNGFIFIVSCDGEVFSVCKTVEHYLGFHQSDILHQSVMELIHSEDRDEFHRQLSWQAMLPPEHRNLTLQEVLSPAYSHLLQRCFTVRFRCLLDNTSGFITLEISGRLQFLHGHTRNFQLTSPPSRGGEGVQEGVGRQGRQSVTVEGHGMATTACPVSSSVASICPSSFGLFGVCSPLGSLPSLDGSQRETSFKTKHKMDLTITNMDARARSMFGFNGKEDGRIKVYDLIHPDDLSYVAQGHREVCKQGSIGLLSHRWLSNTGTWIWLQSRLRIVYKDNKADHIVAIHRKLDDAEGNELYYRRNSEYKLPFPLLEPETLMSEDDSNEINGNDVSSREATSLPEVKSFTDDSNDAQVKVSLPLDSEKELGSGKLWKSFESNNQEPNCGSEIKPSGIKKFKGQSKNYLQTTRRRKTPFKASTVTAKNLTRSSTSYYPGLETGSSSASWYNYRNLFGRNFLSSTGTKTDDYIQNYTMYGYNNGSNRHTYGYHGWDFDRTKSEEDAYCGMLNGEHVQPNGFSYTLPYGNNDYSSAYEAYSAAVAAAAVVAAASGQNQCSEYTAPNNLPQTHESEAYDGAVRVIRSPLIYNTTTHEQQTYVSHQHHSVHATPPQHQALPSFSGYLQHKEEGVESMGGDLISELALKADVGTRVVQPTWFSHINTLSQTIPGEVNGDAKSQPQSQMAVYHQHHQQHLNSTTDTATRDSSAYGHDGVMESVQCGNLIPWNHFENRPSCVGDTGLCETANYQVGFATTT